MCYTYSFMWRCIQNQERDYVTIPKCEYCWKHGTWPLNRIHKGILVVPIPFSIWNLTNKTKDVNKVIHYWNPLNTNLTHYIRHNSASSTNKCSNQQKLESKYNSLINQATSSGHRWKAFLLNRNISKWKPINDNYCNFSD